MKTQNRYVSLLLIALFFLMLQGCYSYRHSISSIKNPERTQGLKAPAPEGEYELITLKGPGVFLSAQVTKQGGANDLTFVILDIDGKNVVNLSIAAAKNWNLTQHNPYGLVLLSDGIRTLTIGYPSPLYFKSTLTLKVHVKESGVEQIIANVIHGK